jgi:transcription-repair coupling factor (superfamily II helicase)
VRLDFLEQALPGSVEPAPAPPAARPARARDAKATLLPSQASIPITYVPDARHRIEVYRKLAQADQKGELESLGQELRDRFGPVPKSVDLLLRVAELRILAAERDISSVEVKDDKVMLTRNNDLIMVGNKFPRLAGKTPEAKIKEIRKLLLALAGTRR